MRQRLSLHLLEVGLISANGVAGHVELRQLVADKKPRIFAEEQTESESVVPYAHLERVYNFFRAYGDNIIHVPVGYIRLGVEVAVGLFAGLNFRLAECDIRADISAALNEQTYLRRLDYSNSADCRRICKLTARDGHFERAVGAFENIAVPIFDSFRGAVRFVPEYGICRKAGACLYSEQQPSRFPNHIYHPVKRHYHAHYNIN